MLKQAAILRDLQPVRLGLIDARQHLQAKSSKRELGLVVNDFKKYLSSRACDQQNKTTVYNIRAISASCGFTCLADIEPCAVESYLSDIITSGRSARTRNRYRSSIVQLLNWAMKRGMVPSNPLTVIGKLNENRDRRRVSRHMTVEQFWRLIDTTARSKRGGAKRSIYYLLAGRVGLRWREIKRLRPHHIDLTGEPAITLTADITKNGRDAVLALGDGVARALRGMELSDPLFGLEPSLLTWKRDLARAGIIGHWVRPDNACKKSWEPWWGYHTHEGTLHRKCLRVTFCTHMYEAGVDLMDAVERMRHSDPKLTMRHYTRIRLVNQRKATDALERPVAPGLRPSSKIVNISEQR